MKILSNTEEGGRVVELSREEMRELYLLVKSCNPEINDIQGAIWDLGVRNRNESMYAEGVDDYNFSKVIGSIRAFRDAQFVANKIKNLGEAFERTIKS